MLDCRNLPGAVLASILAYILNLISFPNSDCQTFVHFHRPRFHPIFFIEMRLYNFIDPMSLHHYRFIQWPEHPANANCIVSVSIIFPCCASRLTVRLLASFEGVYLAQPSQLYNMFCFDCCYTVRSNNSYWLSSSAFQSAVVYCTGHFDDSFFTQCLRVLVYFTAAVTKCHSRRRGRPLQKREVTQTGINHTKSVFIPVVYSGAQN